MAGLGMFMVIFGAVSAWSGWTGRNVIAVFSSTLTGKAQPQAGNNPFQDLTAGLPGAIGGAFSSAITGALSGGAASPGHQQTLPGPPAFNIGPSLGG